MTWYLAADFQLHLILYLVIYLFYRARMLTNLFIGAMFVLGFVSPIAIVLMGIADAPNPSIFLHPTHKYAFECLLTFLPDQSNLIFIALLLLDFPWIAWACSFSAPTITLSHTLPE